MTHSTQQIPTGGAAAWLRRFQPASRAATQLVCFPHAGGAASFYLPVAAAHAPHLDVIAVQYPGRQDRRNEPFIEDIHLLADHITAALLPETTRPMAFFGHSMGSVLAYEVALRLERDHGASPVRLFLSGRRAPSLRRQEAVHKTDNAGLIAELHSLSGTNTALLEDEEVLEMILPAVRADYHAIETYPGRPEGVTVSCPITVLVADDDPHVAPDEARLWAEHTSGAMDLRLFTGGHFYLQKQHAQVNAIIARELLSQPVPRL